MVPKGSIAIDGVSLTLVNVDHTTGRFTVHIIPHTWQHTALASLSPGQRVNLETDMMAKYVRATLQTAPHPPAPAITWQHLQDAGFI